MKEQEIKDLSAKRSKMFRYLRAIFYGLLVLLLILVILGAVLQLSSVQNYLVKKYTDSISKKIGGDISIGKIDFSIIDGVRLRDILILDHKKDTLLFAKLASTSLNSNLISLYHQKLDLNTISLRNANLNVITYQDDTLSNLDIMLKQLAGKDKSENETGELEKSSKPLDFGLDLISLQDLHLLIHDQNTGEKSNIKLDEAEMSFCTIDLSEKLYAIQSLEIDGLSIDLISSVKPPDSSQQVYWLDEFDNTIEISYLKIRDGFFNTKPMEDTGNHLPQFDAKRFTVSNFEADIQNFSLNKESGLFTTIEHISALVNEEVELKEFSCASFMLNKNHIGLTEYIIETAKTTINSTLSLSMDQDDKDQNLIQDGYLNAELNNSIISLAELLYFVPSMKGVAIFEQNKNERIQLTGNISGYLNALKARDIDLRLGSKSRFTGDIFTRNLDVHNEELLNLNVKSLTTDFVSLKRLIPNFNPPDNFNKLGKIEFKGRYDGYFLDFVAYGSLKTALGSAKLDMRLDLKNGSDNALYSGSLNLDQFDLRKWTGNEDFGKVSFSTAIEEGRGLSFNSVDTRLNGTIKSLEYKGYNYSDVMLKGLLNRNLFNGSLQIDDPNIDIDFEGKIDFQDTIPNYKFYADIGNIDLFALHLNGEKLAVSGQLDIDFAGNKLERMIGNSEAQNLKIVNKDSTYLIDRVKVSSQKNGKNGMLFNLESSIADVEIDGVFDLRKIPYAFLRILKQSYPYHTRQLKFDRNLSNEISQVFNFKVNIRDTENILELLKVSDLRIQNTLADGFVDTDQDEFDVNLSTPTFSYGKLLLNQLHAKARTKMGKGLFTLGIDTSSINSGVIHPLTMVTNLSKDTLDFNLATANIIDSLQSIDVNGRLIPHEYGYSLQIDNNDWQMLGKKWEFDTRNQAIIGTEYLSLDDFILTDGHRNIVLDDINNRGLHIKFQNFDLALINSWVDYDKMYFAGEGDVEAKTLDIFKNNEIELNFEFPKFTINDDPFGNFHGRVDAISQNIFDVDIGIEKNEEKFLIKGKYFAKDKELDVKVDVNKYAMSIFEYIINDGISGTKGTADIDARIYGKLDDLKLQGDATIMDAGTRIDYLGTYYSFTNQKIHLDEKFIDLNGAVLHDAKGNSALIKGGLEHSFFSDFNLALSIKSDKFIALNTTPLDNPIYYGFAEGDMLVRFSGAFDRADIKVDATTGPNTNIIFPISSTQSGYDESFIKFVNREDKVDISSFQEEFKLLGLDFEMNLNITDEAGVEMIFDEKVGEVLKGKGNGNLQIYIKRTGDFEVFGNYEIDSGEYLFTAYGLIAKPFKIRRGGLVTWTGDPFDANLNIEAEYTGLRPPLTVFIEEYLAARGSPETELEREAKSRTDVNLVLLLGGTLFSPSVNFDISFPQVTGQLKSYVDTKMRILKSTENGINNQVIGLLVFRNFLPYNNPLSNLESSSLIETGYNTVTEFFTSQLSLVLTDLIQKELTDESLIKGIDVNIAFSKNTSIGEIPSDGGLAPDIIDLNLRNHFKNDNFVVNLGANYVIDSPLGAGNYFVSDVGFSWYMTKNRRLVFNMYNRYDYDETLSSRKIKSGVGIRFKTEFGTFSDFQKEVQRSSKELQKSIKGKN